MKVLLQNTYEFTDVRVLQDEQATRQGILNALDQLVADAQRGDLVVFYFAGHGSRRLDTASSKNHLDETIVPADAWMGVEDIRDKELALRFNKIVYDKQARLTAIYDSCHSGTMARGITNSVQRTLPWDDRDVAKEPGAVLEADVKRIPQNGNAIILAAAASTESAVEAQYPPDGQYHGAFTRALVRVLQSNTQVLSAADVVAEVSSMLHADPVPFQQPSAEGRVEESLFGAPVAEHALHVRVTGISDNNITLDVGSAAGFDTGTQFTTINPGPDGQKTVLEVKSVDEPLVSTANVVSGPTNVEIGQIFELSMMTYPQAARLVVFLPKPGPVPNADALAKTKLLFPALTWVDDPTTAQISFLVMQGPKGWVAIGQNGHAVPPGGAAKGPAFLILGPTPALVDRIEQSEPFLRKAFRFTGDIHEANYVLTMRPRPDGTGEYALFNPEVLAPHKPDTYIRSPENDPEDTEQNAPGDTEKDAPDVVCRNDVSLPVRTAWLHNNNQIPIENNVSLAIERRIVRIGKLRVWLQSPSLASGIGSWPYHLDYARVDGSSNGALHLNDKYDVKLVATPAQMAAAAPIPRHIYLFGFDCAANPYLLYPPKELNGDATFPQPGENGVFPTSITLMTNWVDKPFGADTLFFMATKEKIADLSLLTSDGVIEKSMRGSINKFEELFADMNDAGTRGVRTVPTNWLVQQVVIPSKP
jgi:hypothetical protein